MTRQPDDETTSNPLGSESMKHSALSPFEVERRIEDEIRATVRAFEEDAPPPLGPGFYAGVRRKIRGQAAGPAPFPRLGFAWKILVPAALALLAALNIVTAVEVSQTKKSSLTAKRDAVTALAEDYNVGRIGYASYVK